MDLAIELQRIYDSEINLTIGWLWDGGIEVRLGDEMNGFLAGEIVPPVAEIIRGLKEAIAHFFPTSTYATGIAPEVKQRAADRLFRPTRIGAQVICPHCGAPNPTPPGMDEIFAFVCTHYGNGVEVKPPKIQ